MLQELLGLVGVALILSAYFAVQSRKMSSEETLFSVLNSIGAALVLLSLAGSNHIAAIALEAAWLLISLYGLYCALYKKTAQ